MLTSEHQSKIGDVIVPSVLVQMMHNLIRCQHAAKMLRHDVTVFQHSATTIRHRMPVGDDKQVFPLAFLLHALLRATQIGDVP